LDGGLLTIRNLKALEKPKDEEREAG